MHLEKGRLALPKELGTADIYPMPSLGQALPFLPESPSLAQNYTDSLDDL